MRVKLKFTEVLVGVSSLLLIILLYCLVFRSGETHEENKRLTHDEGKRPTIDEGKRPTHDEDKRPERVLLEHVTRDPNRTVYYNSHLTYEASTSKEPIDISLNMPPWKELDKHIVVVTSVKGDLEARMALGMIASVQAHMSSKKIIVYTLRISQSIVRQMKMMCNVEVRKFNFRPYPRHVSTTDNRAWKIYALREVLKEYGAFFYASPRVRFRAPIHFIIPYLARQDGMVATIDRANLSVAVTHPEMYRVFHTSAAKFEVVHPNAHIAADHVWVAVNSSTTESGIWDPLLSCASQWRCIGPYGSTWKDVDPTVGRGKLHTHRYDMSALSLLLYRNYNDKWFTDKEMNSVLNRIIALISHDDDTLVRDFKWAHYCSPAKNEVDCPPEVTYC